LLLDSIGILDKLSTKFATIKTLRLEQIAQAVEVPFVIAVNITLWKIRFGAISLEIVSAISLFGGSLCMCRYLRFKLIGAREIQGAVRRLDFQGTQRTETFGLPGFGLGAAQFQRAALGINRFKSSIDCFSRFGGIAVERGEFLGFFGKQVGDDRLNKVLAISPIRTLNAGLALLGIADLLGDKFIPGVLREAGFLLEVFLNVGDGVTDSAVVPSLPAPGRVR